MSCPIILLHHAPENAMFHLLSCGGITAGEYATGRAIAARAHRFVCSSKESIGVDARVREAWQRAARIAQGLPGRAGKDCSFLLEAKGDYSPCPLHPRTHTRAHTRTSQRMHESASKILPMFAFVRMVAACTRMF